MALKKRTVVSPAAGAVSLPSLMAELPGTRRLEEVPLDKPSPAPAAGAGRTCLDHPSVYGL